VVTEWELEEHHVKLLTLAAEALDRAEEARELLARAGTFYRDRFGQPKPHPAVAVERDARVAFARLPRELDLDTVAPPEAPRAARRAPPDRGNTPVALGAVRLLQRRRAVGRRGLRALWTEYREELLRECHALYGPDVRPWAFWRYEASGSERKNAPASE
jgi:hypothetical protein